MMKKKVLLMGKSGSGKTSMRSIIFANYIARDTRRLGPTMEVEHAHVRFLGNLALNIWDCGGQELFMENYFASQRDQIFRNVEVLIYVFDVESREVEKDYQYYQTCLEALIQNSPDAKIFCLVHKMDLVHEDHREQIFSAREEDLKKFTRPLECTCFKTSIWDETLYKAWSSIVYKLIPNVEQLEKSLRLFAEVIDADEVLLFEKATFLVISHCQRKPHKDVHRFEKVSNIIKQFKLSCSKLGTSFSSTEIRNSHFAAFIDAFTINTYVMVVVSDPKMSEMRPLTDEETEIVFRKLSKYIGDNVKYLIDRSDGTYCFRYHMDRIYYCSEDLMKKAASITRENLLCFGTCLGKFTKSKKFRLHITALDYLSPYAKFKVWVKPNAEQQFLYGNHVLKSGLGRITDGTSTNMGVVVYNMADVPLGFGVTAKSTTDSRRADPTAIIVLNQADNGEYIRNESDLT